MGALPGIPVGLGLFSRLALLALVGVFLLPTYQAVGDFADQLRAGCASGEARFNRVLSAPSGDANAVAWEVASGPGDACVLQGVPYAQADAYAPDDTRVAVANNVIANGQWSPAPVAALERLIVPLMGFTYALLFLALIAIIW